MAKRYVKEKGLVRAVTSDNLGLEKPLANENYDIEVHNRNMDKIDSAIIEDKSNISSLQSSISSLQTKVNNGQNHKITQDNGTVARQDNIDLNTLTKTGFYYSASPTNAPMGIVSAWYIDVKAMNSGTYVYQKAIRNSATDETLQQYERNMHNGTWTAWRELQTHKLTQNNGSGTNLSTGYDLNVLNNLGTGFYYGDNFVNAPETGWVMVEHIKYGKSSTQKCTVISNERVYTRRSDNGNWSEWREL